MNKLVLWNDLTLFWGKNPRAISMHSHPIIQLVIGRDGHHFLSKNGEGIWEEKKGLLIAPNVHHECDARNLPILSLAIDPDSSLGEWIIEQYCSQQKVIPFPSEGLESQVDAQIAALVQQEKWPALRLLITALFDYQLLARQNNKDKRIVAVLKFISKNIHTPINTKILTQIAFLSESRLLHLFKQEMGLPIRNYILWYRLQVALKYILKGHSLTEAAHFAGFADQAHMTRTCVKMMGLPPSVIVKNSKFVQVSFPD